MIIIQTLCWASCLTLGVGMLTTTSATEAAFCFSGFVGWFFAALFSRGL